MRTQTKCLNLSTEAPANNRQLPKTIKPVSSAEPSRCLILCLALAASQLHGQLPVTNGLVAYYPFNGNANDASGNGNNGTPDGVSYGADRFGNPNAAASFAGNSNSYIQVDTTNLNLTSDFSISVWINYVGGSGIENPRIVSTAGYGISIAPASSSDRGLSFYNNTLTAGAPNVIPTNTVPPNVWTHVVAVRSGTNLLLYLNASLIGSVSTTEPPDYSAGFIPTIAVNSAGLNRDNYGGLIDDLAIYNRALSAAEVNLLFGSSAHVTLTGLIQQGANSIGQTESTPVWTTGASVNYANIYVTAPNDGYTAPFLNPGYGTAASISYSLTPGVYEFYFFAVNQIENNPGVYGLNLFFGGDNTNPGISAFSPLNAATATPVEAGAYTLSLDAAEFQPVRATGSLTYSTNGLSVTLTGYGYGTPGTFGGPALDRVGNLNSAPDGQLDAVGFFSLSVAYWPSTASAVAFVTNGFVVSAMITNPGYGYTNVPSIYFIGGGGTNAQATATISNGLVTAINMVNAGSGYTNTPVIIISPPVPASFSLAIAPATYLSFTNLAVGTNYQLQESQSGAWVNVGSSFAASASSYSQYVDGSENGSLFRLAVLPIPTGATATPQVTNGFVVGATVTSNGSGYLSVPAVQIVGGGGIGAQATATVSNGMVTAINMVNAGSGYTNTPTIQIDPPPVTMLPPAISNAFRLDCSGLAVPLVYQVQTSVDLVQWTNFGASFTATAATNSQYSNVGASSQFFRLSLQ